MTGKVAVRTYLLRLCQVFTLPLALLLFTSLFIAATAEQGIAQDVEPESTSTASRNGRLIKQVSFFGNKRVLESVIREQISSVEGTVYDESTVNLDVKEIFRTGFFNQVYAVVNPVGPEIELIFQLEEKKSVRNVFLEGNSTISDDDIKENIGNVASQFYDRRRLQIAANEIEKLYQEKGYYDAEVEFDTEEIDGEEVDVSYTVYEGDKKVIREIIFEGNREIDEGDLKGVIETSEYSWLTSWVTGSGTYKKEIIPTDVARLSRYYLTQGYADIQVSEPQVEDKKDGLVVRFKVSEGRLYSFGRVFAEGDLIQESQEKTLEDVETVADETFNVELLRKDSFLITGKFTDIGYAFTNVEPITSIRRRDGKVDVKFKVDKGELIQVNRIHISGNTKTRDNVIRRSLQISELEQYSGSKIKRSEELLKRLGFFEEVSITPEKTKVRDTVNLNVSVREGSTGSFSLGAGVSSGDGFLFTAQVSESNLFGTGNSVGVNLDTGSSNQNFSISFTNPRVDDTQLSVGLRLLSYQTEFDDFDNNQAGGSITFGYPLWFLGPEYLDDIRGSIKYEYLDIEIDDVAFDAPTLIKEEEGKTSSSSITPGVVRNTINNPLDPTEGSRQSLSFEIAGIGGEEEFWLIEARNAFFRPLAELGNGTIVFSNRIKVGYGDTMNGDTFPLFRRYFEGGINSVRGFDARELGPKDENGDEYGGSKTFVSNFELIFPVLTELGVKLVTFYDIGNAFDDDEEINISDLRPAWGWGIRWRSPIAPIRIEFGYPIDKEEGDSSVVTHFSFGGPF